MVTLGDRWIKRLDSFSKALKQLSKFIDKGDLNELEQQGLIQAFEYTFELAWNTIKDYFLNQGEIGLYGSRDTLRLAYQRGLIIDGDIWMEMITSRTLTSHTYDEETLEKIATAIVNSYYSHFCTLESKMQSLRTSM